MRGADDPADGAEGRRGADDALADNGVLSDERPVALVERAGLVKDLVGDRDLADVVEHRRALELIHRVLVQAQCVPDGDGKVRDAVRVGVKLRLAFVERLQEDLMRLVAGRAPAAFLDVQPLVRLSEGADAVAGVLGEQHCAKRARYGESLALLREGVE